MCQLLGVNANRPSHILSLWSGFQQRGGKTAVHGDGWGLSFFEGKAVRILMDEHSCCDSSLALWLKHCSFRSTNIIGHIRRASEGKVGLANTHPFVRELWGRNWVFAHNGQLKNFFPRFERFNPIGETDSERAFCWLLDRLVERFPAVTPFTLPPWESLWAVLQELITEISQHGVFNFLLSYGDFMVVRCATHLQYIVRKAPFPVVRLLEEEAKIDLGHVYDEDAEVVVIATQPLTDELWIRMEPGEMIVFHGGRSVYRVLGEAGNTPGWDCPVGK
jgi:predicted glutamine amidotransferase